ncbi:MAG: hypothetical protein N2327_02905 [Caldimicrobium sp.]|nr:hypothetical protein [Caldimicrobium sp.]
MIKKEPLFGNPSQLWIQLLSVVVVLIYDLLVTAIILLGIKVTMGLRSYKEEEIAGLDLSHHGERAYDLE